MKVGVERSRVLTLLPRDSRGMDQTPRSLKGSRAGAASWPKPLLETRLRQQGGGQPECEQAGSGAAETPLLPQRMLAGSLPHRLACGS